MNMRDLPLGITEQLPPPPPPKPPIEDQRETFLPTQPLRFYPIDLGIALGLTAALFMLFTMIIATFVNPSGLRFFEDIFAGFKLQWIPLQVLLNLVWAFSAGFVIGTFTGLIYNWLLRKYVASEISR